MAWPGDKALTMLVMDNAEVGVKQQWMNESCNVIEYNTNNNNQPYDSSHWNNQCRDDECV